MEVIAQKAKSVTVLMIELITGAVIMLAAFIILPIHIFSIDKELLSNGFVWGVVIVCMLFFGSVGFFGFIRPYFLFRKLPDVQAETDGTYLYIHSTKEAKIPLAEMEGTYLNAELPYIMSRGFLVHLLSDKYGKVIINVPGYGKYKLHFIAGAYDVPARLAALIESKL